MSLRKKAAWSVGVLLVAAVVALLFGHKQERVRLLYLSGGASYDRAAYLNFKQSLVANADVSLLSAEKLSLRRLRGYDAVYLDVFLKQTPALREAVPMLQAYVEGGGHLFVENDLLHDLPKELLGASAIVPVPAPAKPEFGYPQVRGNLQGLQDVFRQFADTFVKHVDMNLTMPGFNWGQAVVPSTAETVVTLNGQPLCTINRYGRGTVFAAGAFLPNRYFITGFDLMSGMDPAAGFSVKAKLHDETIRKPGSSLYFNFKEGLPQEPYFHFAFAAANHLFRNEYIAFVSKETLGYSVKKVLGPYGRPAMAYQNHFEALPAFEREEGIAWAELLKTYNQIPSFSLIRSSFDWYHWYESVVVHLNVGSTEQPQFVGEFPNSFYSSGTYVMSGDSLLTLAAFPGNAVLAQKLDLPYRAYPALADLNGDGLPDLIVGSADGFLYRYTNIGRKPSTQMVPDGVPYPDGFSAPEKLLLANGEPLETEGYASVTAADLNGDGQPDLVIGSENGQVVAAMNQGRGAFASPVPLLAGGGPVKAVSHSAPAVGDLDRDGVPDLVVGDAQGQLTLYRGVKGRPLQFGRPEPLFRIRAEYAAPAVKDMNGDKLPDLVVGNSEGDLLVYVQTNGGWIAKGPITGRTSNPMGSKALVGGQYSVPLWADLNRDGKEDLIVGQIAYSKPVAIDDPHFPYKKQLAKFIEYAKANKLELYPHVYVHNFLSPEQEKLEIELHRKAFAALGIPWTHTGTNQHTWRINNPDRLQTLRSENEAGIWFNFGFKPSHNPLEPQWGQDFLWGFPFLLDDPQLTMPMMLYTPGFSLRLNREEDTSDLYRAYAALDLPIDYFEHIEYHQTEPGKLARLEEFVRYFDGLRTAYDYNFMSEPQMARSFLAVMTCDIRVERPWLVYAIDRLKSKFGRGLHLTLTLSADTRGVPEMAAEYRNTAGVVFEPGERYAGYPFATDSPVFLKKENKLYVGLGLRRDTAVSINWDKEPFHVVRANVPIDIRENGKAWTIFLNSDGMQQIKLYSPQPLEIDGTGLKIEQDPQKGLYTVTHFGEKTRITVRMR